jgi:hypothetical protein
MKILLPFALLGCLVACPRLTAGGCYRSSYYYPSYSYYTPYYPVVERVVVKEIVTPIAVLAPVSVIAAYGAGAVPTTAVATTGVAPTVAAPQAAPPAPAAKTSCEQKLEEVLARLAALERAGYGNGGNGGGARDSGGPPPAVPGARARADGAPAVLNKCLACHTEGKLMHTAEHETTFALFKADGAIGDLSAMQMLKILNRVGRPHDAAGAMPPPYSREQPPTDAEYADLAAWIDKRTK